MKRMRVLWSRDQNRVSELKVMGGSLQSSYFDILKQGENSSGELSEKWFIGAHVKESTHRVSLNPHRVKKFDIERTLLESHFGKGINDAFPFFKIEDYDESKIEFKVTLISNPAGDTNIKITISNVKILAHTSIYMSLLNFFNTDESVYPEIQSGKNKFKFFFLQVFYLKLNFFTLN